MQADKFQETDTDPFLSLPLRRLPENLTDGQTVTVFDFRANVKAGRFINVSRIEQVVLGLSILIAARWSGTTVTCLVRTP